jgi:hypothetical protein
LFLDPRKQQAAIRKDIWEDRIKAAGEESSGGDFYGPFWADAKRHVFAEADLRTMVDQRVARNPNRRNLYPRLRDGFLLWWNERRRWTNEPFRPGQPAKTRFQFPRLDVVVKVDNILSVRDGVGAERLVYPYFAPEPVLSEQAARLGLWLLVAALPAASPDAIRILDVIRGRTFSLDRTPLRGDEERELRRLYADLLRRRDELRDEDD